MDDDEAAEVTIPSRKFRWIDLVITTLDTAAGFLDDVVQMLCAHANWNNDRQRMAREASEQIERMVSGE